MDKLLLFLISLTASSLTYGQYCMSGGPSSNADSNLESLSLVGASGFISYTGCPGVLGVEEYLSQTAFLDAGASYTTNLQFGTCGGNFSGVGEAWIDFNANLIFEPSESIGTWSGLPPTAASVFNFTVPAAATSGSTRMRVVHAEGGSLPIDPCAAFTWGSATDFSIMIQNGIDCSAYIGDDSSDPRMVSSIPFTENYDNSFCYTNQNTVYNSPDVFYLITPLTGFTSIDVSLCGSSFDTFLTVTDANGNPLVINDDSPSCGTQSKVTIATAGHDSLYAIVEGWGNAMGAYTINVVQGTLDISELTSTQFKLYPNPATNSVQIGNEFSGTVQFVDANGRTIQTNLVMQGESIDTGNLPRGFYLVRLQSANQQTIQKLILE